MKKQEYYFDLQRDSLHRHLAGAIPKGITMLIEGGHGDGKSALSQRLLYGFLSHGYSVTYISTELTTKGFVDQMESMDYDVLKHMLTRNLMFIPVFSIIGKPVPEKEFLKRLLSSPWLFEKDIIIIDSFSSLIKEGIEKESIFKIMTLFKRLAGKSKDIITTMDPNDASENIINRFRSISDVYLELKTTMEEGEQVHNIVVRRFVNATERVGNVITFRIEPGAGLIVDITMVA